MHLRDEKRRLIIKLSEEGKSNAEIVNILSCSRHQVYRKIKIFDAKGRTQKKNTGGFKGKNYPRSKMILYYDLVDEDCTVTLKELRIKRQEWFGVQVSITTISKSLGDFLYGFKRVHNVPERRNCPAIINIRYDYIIKFLRLISSDESRIIFINETGFNISMRSVYGRSPRNTQPTKVVKSIRSKNISMSCCINKVRMIFYEQNERPYDKNNFGALLLNLFAKLEELNLNNCTFIMDNMPFHKCQEIENSITDFRIQFYICLPIRHSSILSNRLLEKSTIE